MSKPELQQYHCSKCNSVFRAVVATPGSVLCSYCGKSPVSEAGFNSISQMDTVLDDDASHGVPGHDTADFFSMQKARRRRQAKWALTLWLALLVVGGGVVFYNREIEVPVEEEPSEVVKREREYKATLVESTGAAFQQFDRYINADNVNEKSEYVLGGVRKLLQLEQKESSIDLRVPKPPFRLLANSYIETGELPRVELIIEDNTKRRFEVVMWHSNLKWLLDWEQHVRYTQNDWSAFLANEGVGDPREFRLYARRRNIEVGRERDRLQLIFYKPKMESGERSQESPRVNVFKDSPFFERLNMAFEAAEAENADEEVLGASVVRQLDSEGLLRMKVTLDWERGPEDEAIMVLKDVAALHWLELAPNKSPETEEE